MYSCHFKRLSCVIFTKQTVPAGGKYVAYCTCWVSRLRQVSIWSSNVNLDFGGSLLKAKVPKWVHVERF